MRLGKLLIKAGSIGGYLVGLVGAVATIWLLDQNYTIELRWIVLIAIGGVVLIYEAIVASIEFDKISKEGTRFLIISYEKNERLCCINYTPNLRVGAIVCIYHYQNARRAERIGYGFVSNIEIGNYVEIEIFDFFPEKQNTFEDICSDSKRITKELYIFPNVYKEDIAKLAAQLIVQEEG